MGTPKQLLAVEGRPLLQLVVEQACASRLDHVVVVLGAAADEIRARVDFSCAGVLVNAEHASGMSSSLRAGFASLGSDIMRAVIILGDQPDISPELIDRLLDLQETSGLPAAALSFEGVTHPPVVLRRELWPGVMELEGDVGWRAVIRARPELVATLPHASDHKHPIDVDTPADYARFRGITGTSSQDS
jgi:molybdenum cofactor cytidylyltransferase